MSSVGDTLELCFSFSYSRCGLYLSISSFCGLMEYSLILACVAHICFCESLWRIGGIVT